MKIHNKNFGLHCGKWRKISKSGHDLRGTCGLLFAKLGYTF